ncbi:MAG: isocitrate lyase/phosphoenolpyruvate mutase family protein [Candidatus Omnitrophica bacterium]|nr:isocitrate lyase/phosphoenolpyruvate mutase family protein [Candidatus Omnitrophota bacterium]
MNKSTLFRKLLKTRRPVLLSGAHDALSAKLTEEAGFDAVWVSSFGVSAAMRLMPDANVLTMTEMLETAKGINDAVGIPVIADCDNGYGNVHNIIRMVREYERAGIAGVSIEDNPFPKKCSLYPGERPDLVDADEMAGRIHAAKQTQSHRDFFVIARTEALIAGLGMDEAMNKALKYEAAGADAILIHSRQKSPAEIREFCRRWKSAGRVPLVAVPTKYPGITSKELYRTGIRVVIFANQALRASVSAMQKTLKTMKDADSVQAAESSIAPLSEIFRLVGQPQLEANEKRYLEGFKSKRGAIIVAAGFEKELWPLNEGCPKTLLPVGGKSILERQVHALNRCGITDIAVVGGHHAEKIRLPGVTTITNPRYRKGGMLHSLFCARERMDREFVFVYGDVLFDDYILSKLLKSKKDITLAVDRFPNRSAGSAANRDWVTLDSVRSNAPPAIGALERVASIGRHIDPSKADGEFIGLASFSDRGARTLRDTYRRLTSRPSPKTSRGARNFQNAEFTDLAQELIRRRQNVHSLNIRGGWIDIDSFEDYRKAWKRFSSHAPA